MSAIEPIQGQPSIVEHWCVTDLMKTSVSQNWTINNFKMYCEEMKFVLKSSKFEASGEGIPKCVWRLKLYPRGGDKAGKYISIYLVLISCSRTKVPVSFTLSILSAVSENFTKKIRANRHTFVTKSDWGFKNFAKREIVLNPNYGLIDDGKLRVRCEIFFWKDPNQKSGVSNIVQVPKTSFSTDLTRLFDSKEFGDVILKANDGREFHAHKNILWARCSVFERMFQVDMTENIENLVALDMSSEVLNSILCYIYTDEFKPVDKIVELLQAAEMYDLGRLKALCEMELSSKLTVDTVTDILQMAVAHRAHQLRQQAVNFVVRNANEVLQTGGWNALVSKMPEVAKTIVEKLASP